jgi:hypothetical protein
MTRVQEECDKFRDINQTLNECDETIFSSEEAYVQEIVDNAIVWPTVVDYRALQNSLHTRVVAGKYFELDALKRTIVIEEEFKRETKLLRSSIDMIQASAGRSEIEKELFNINKNAKESASLALREMESAKLLVIEEEKNRQQSLSDIDFEQEYAAAVENNCHRAMQINRKVRESRRKVWQGLVDVLNDKKSVFAQTLEQQKQPYILQSYLLKQIENEILREQFEMKSVYQDLVCCTVILISYRSDDVHVVIRRLPGL